MAYNVYIAKVKNIRPAENADKLNLCEVFGNTTVVDKSVNENDLYVYLPVDGQISEEYGKENDLFRRKDENGNAAGGFIDPKTRRITAIKLRGNKSDGLVMPLASLKPFGDISGLHEGDIVTVFNGHEIACKYIPIKRVADSGKAGNRTRKKKVPIAPLFAEHADTEQLVYNLADFHPGDQIEITLKMHGTSQRTGYLPVLKGYKRTLLDRILRRDGTPIYDWGYVTGTRRTVLDDYEGGFYGSNEFREKHSKTFEGKLWKGETAYYEVVGFTTTGQPIMGSCSNKKLDKDFVKQYGEETVFSYGCEPSGQKVVMHEDIYGDRSMLPIDVPQSDIYVYRMTMTNEDGEVIEYTPDFMRYRCEQIGVKTVPVFWKGIIPKKIPVIGNNNEIGAPNLKNIDASEYIRFKAEEFYDGPDPIGKTHVREGVVVRIINRPKFTAYKHKNFSFKQITGIISEKLSTENTKDISDDILSEF
jgi:hypothetical protein